MALDTPRWRSHTPITTPRCRDQWGAMTTPGARFPDATSNIRCNHQAVPSCATAQGKSLRRDLGKACPTGPRRLPEAVATAPVVQRSSGNTFETILA